MTKEKIHNGSKKDLPTNKKYNILNKTFEHELEYIDKINRLISITNMGN